MDVDNVLGMQPEQLWLLYLLHTPGQSFKWYNIS